jgi:hypothetical protein
MRKTLLLSAAFFGFTAGAFAPTSSAQTSSTPGATPQAPPEMTAPGATQMPMSHGQMPMPLGQTPMSHGQMPMSHGMDKSAADADIRPGHVPGVGDSFPASNKASNVTPSDTHSVIAPRLPAPAGGPNATPAAFLTDAQNALKARQTGRAQEALERAETALLQRSVPADQASVPDQSPGVQQIRAARDALAKGDIAGAQKAIAGALSAS